MRNGIGEGLEFRIGLAQAFVQTLNHFKLARLLPVMEGKVIGLAFDDLGLPLELNENANLGFKNLGNDRQKQVIHRA